MSCFMVDSEPGPALPLMRPLGAGPDFFSPPERLQVHGGEGGIHFTVYHPTKAVRRAESATDDHAEIARCVI